MRPSKLFNALFTKNGISKLELRWSWFVPLKALLHQAWYNATPYNKKKRFYYLDAFTLGALWCEAIKLSWKISQLLSHVSVWYFWMTQSWDINCHFVWSLGYQAVECFWTMKVMNVTCRAKAMVTISFHVMVWCHIASHTVWKGLNARNISWGRKNVKKLV